jgi:hypothetical protein
VITIVLPVKATNEVIPISVNFSDMLQFGEAITGASCTCTVFSGTDPSPSALVSGIATYTGSTVTQNITGGLAGNIYTLAFIVTASNSHNYVKVGQLSVISPSNTF